MEFSTLREKIAHESKARAARNDGFVELVARAHEAGLNAGYNARPVPMGVIDKNCIYRIDDGACGFAWVSFPGNTAFGRWAKKQGIARPHWPSGLCVWVSEFGQSVDRKSAYAGAYARVLNDAGIAAYAGSRLD